MNYFLRINVILIVLFKSASLTAGDLSAADQLSEQLKPMNSLTATFDQAITDGEGTLLQSASGILTVKRPRHFYWRTQQPYEHLVVTDGDVLWLYDIDLEQITRQGFTADLDKAPALLLSGEVGEINKQYTVTVESASDKSRRYTLTPRSEDALFKELTIAFTHGVLDAMGFLDSFDQKTVIQFAEVKLNPLVDDELFKFTPPEGIDVISNEP